jgi:hypothetical protein
MTGSARQQARTQKGGFAGAGRTQHHHQRFDALLDHAAQTIEAANNHRVATEENRGVFRLKRAKSTIGRSRRIGRWRPRKAARVETGAIQPSPQHIETFGAERDLRRLSADGDVKYPRRFQLGEVAHLPFGSHLDRDTVERHGLDDQPENPLVQCLRE